MLKAYDENVDKKLLIRRLNITANRVVPEETLSQTPAPYQFSLFEDYKEIEKQKATDLVLSAQIQQLIEECR